MPSLETAWRLLRHDRALFRRRLIAYLVRLADGPLARISGGPPLFRDIPPRPLAAEPGRRRMLIVFSCNPFFPSGVGTSILAQGELLRSRGYALDAVWYALDDVTRASRDAFLRRFERAALIFPQTSRRRRAADGVTALALDDWCGREAVEACAQMMGESRYAGLIAHQPWLSKILDRAPAGVHKYLFMHDNFAGRAELFESQGLARRLAWLNLSAEAQALCLKRADTVFAVQDEERAVFARQAGPAVNVVTAVIVLPDKTGAPAPARGGRLSAGLVASANENNRVAAGGLIRLWEKSAVLRAEAELRIAGDVCAFLKTKEPSIKLLGRLGEMDSFYAGLHVAVNPDFGGTGLKVKSLEALSHGKPLLCGPAGAQGLGSAQAAHNLRDRAGLIGALEGLARAREGLGPLREASMALFKRYNEAAGRYLQSFPGGRE